MRTIGVILCFSVLLISCNKTFKDEELMLPWQNYEGDELKIDGYYYQYGETGTYVKYLFRNGIILSGYHFTETLNLDEVEIEMVKEYDLLQKDKSRWGIFVINGSEIQYSAWSTSVGGGLPVFKSMGVIENDTTFRITRSINSDGREFEENDIYHFRKFSPKPDSTNNFIK